MVSFVLFFRFIISTKYKKFTRFQWKCHSPTCDSCQKGQCSTIFLEMILYIEKSVQEMKKLISIINNDIKYQLISMLISQVKWRQ